MSWREEIHRQLVMQSYKGNIDSTLEEALVDLVDRVQKESETKRRAFIGKQRRKWYMMGAKESEKKMALKLEDLVKLSHGLWCKECEERVSDIADYFMKRGRFSIGSNKTEEHQL